MCVCVYRPNNTGAQLAVAVISAQTQKATAFYSFVFVCVHIKVDTMADTSVSQNNHCCGFEYLLRFASRQTKRVRARIYTVDGILICGARTPRFMRRDVVLLVAADLISPLSWQNGGRSAFTGEPSQCQFKLKKESQ